MDTWAAWAQGQGPYAVGCFVLLAGLVFAVNYIIKLIGERNELYKESLIAAQQRTDALHETSRALERVSDGQQAHRESTAAIMTVATSLRGAVDDIARQLRDVADRIDRRVA